MASSDFFGSLGRDSSWRRAWLAVWFVGAVVTAGSVLADDSDDQPPPPRPVRSDECTASAGRRPLSARIAVSTTVPKPTKAAAADAADPDASASAEAAALTEPVATEPVAPEPEPVPSKPVRSRAAANVRASVAPKQAPKQAESDKSALLSKVKARLASISEPPPRIDRATGRPVPPRLSIDVVESRVEAVVGQTLSWQIRLRNDGATAHDVAATLFFAEGIEPTSAAGVQTTIAAGEVRFATIDKLESGETVELTVCGKATQAGPVVSRAEAGCREIPGTIAREGVVVILPK